MKRHMDKKSTVKTSTLLQRVQQRMQSKRGFEENQKNKLQNSSVDVPDIPQECVFDIMIRLPLESLVTSRLVCKLWYEIVNSPIFKKAYQQQLLDIGLIFVTPAKNFSSSSKTTFSVESKISQHVPLIDPPPLFHIKFMEIKDGKSTLKEYNATCTGSILAACNGLILLENRMKKRGGLILLNPVTRELISIPLGTISPVDCESYGLAFCHESSRYKLVHLFVDSFKYIGCEIMDVGSGSWRSVNGPPKAHFNKLSNPIFAMGALHWAPSIVHIEDIVSMRLDEEKFVNVPIPTMGQISNRFFEMGGFLGLASCQEVNRIDVWVLRGLGSEGWEKQYSINIDGISEIVPLYCGRFNGELVFRCGGYNVYAYDHNLGLMRKIEMIKEWPKFVQSYFPHVNSLISWRS